MTDGIYRIDQIKRLRNTKEGNPRFALWLVSEGNKPVRVLTKPDTQCAFLFSEPYNAGKTMYFEFTDQGQIDFARELTEDER